MTRRFWAPGRVNLIGEHTDYSGGLVLPAALELGIVLEGDAAERTSLTSPVPGWERYAAAVEAELAKLGRPAVGFAGRIASTLPVGAGLSSSAALEVAVATALCAVADFQPAPEELARACQRAELRAVGVPCGIMDQAASILGQAGHVILIDTATLDHRLVRLPDGMRLVVVDSGVRRRLEHSDYAERRRELEEALAGSRLPVHVRRLRHVTTENERVRETVGALERDPPDLMRIGEVFRAGHESLRDDFEVSTPELDLLVDLAYGAGALAARMTGGGFGGSIVALVPDDRASAVGAEIVARYTETTTCSPAVYISTPADGARELHD